MWEKEMYESVSLRSKLRVCPKCANLGKMLISVVSVFLSLWTCSTDSPEHILDGTGCTSIWLIPSDSVWCREKGHIALPSTKLPLRGLLFLYFSFLFNQEENSEREGKATPLSSVKALCMQRAALRVFITSLGTEGQSVPQAARGTLEREKGALETPWRDCSWGRSLLGQDRSCTWLLWFAQQ